MKQAVCSSLVPSVMNPDVSTTSCADVPDVRATLADSRFYLSLEDDLMRLFGGDRITNMMDSLKIDENMPIENRMLTSSIENAQSKVEGRNFGIQ